MILGTGIDITDTGRMASLYLKYGNKLLGKFLTPAEIDLMPVNFGNFLAGRFAAKEAAVKALGTGFSMGITALQIEVRTNSSGAPKLTFYEKAKERADWLGVKSIFLSISHERTLAVAMVILES